MKIVLKVPITCKKCKSCILQIVSKTKGIKSLTFDDEKSTLTVIGEVDVVNCCRACRPYYIVDDQPGYSCTIV
ncbi:hypothetical protein E2562_014625 [Oryza meyeriana var. granulata]|uniref:HMA domain-containing protein n=1 Tax=Oryza meyeriana var. granulata TaxID=110450 RepID=A0A6G1DWW5_9ORYZ|nr:hypothetical protein E2562_014625 [Oryza meyeriana var. granulata]